MNNKRIIYSRFNDKIMSGTHRELVAAYEKLGKAAFNTGDMLRYERYLNYAEHYRKNN